MPSQTLNRRNLSRPDILFTKIGRTTHLFLLCESVSHLPEELSWRKGPSLSCSVRRMARARRKSMCGAPSAMWCHRVARRRRHLRRTTDTTKTVWPTFPSIEALVVAVAAVYTESGLLEPHIRTGDKNLFKNRNFDVLMHIILVNWRTTRISWD